MLAKTRPPQGVEVPYDVEADPVGFHAVMQLLKEFPASLRLMTYGRRAVLTQIRSITAGVSKEERDYFADRGWYFGADGVAAELERFELLRRAAK